MGTNNYTFEELNELFNLSTSNIDIKSNTYTNKNDTNDVENFISIEIHCLDSNIARLFELLTEFLTKVNF